MKILKWTAFVLSAVLVTLILALEATYYSRVNDLKLKPIYSDLKLPDSVYEVAWVSSGETGEMAMEKISATEYAFDFAILVSSDNLVHKGEKFGKGTYIASQASRYFYQTPHKPALDRHLDNIAATIWLTRNTSSQELMNVMLERSYFGYGISGIESAGKFYFNKELSSLDLNEVIALVSMIKAPSRFNPYCRPERLTQRAEWISTQLASNWPATYGSHSFEMPVFVEIEDPACK